MGRNAAMARWDVFMTLYDSLDEFAAHYIHDNWPQVSHLYLQSCFKMEENWLASFTTHAPLPSPPPSYVLLLLLTLLLTLLPILLLTLLRTSFLAVLLTLLPPPYPPPYPSPSSLSSSLPFSTPFHPSHM